MGKRQWVSRHIDRIRCASNRVREVGYVRTHGVTALKVTVTLDKRVRLSKNEHERVKITPALTHSTSLKVHQTICITHETVLNVMTPLVRNDSVIKG